MIYAIAKNVVRPAMISSLTFDPRSRILKNLSIFSLPPEKYLYKFADMVRLYLKDTYPEPKTHEFIVMAKYNQMIDSMVEEFVRSEITKIV